MYHMKKQTIFLVPATLLMIVLVPTLPTFASNSNDEGSDNTGSDVSCSPITGNPHQEKCDETKNRYSAVDMLNAWTE
jgi:hypothetical protein